MFSVRGRSLSATGVTLGGFGQFKPDSGLGIVTDVIPLGDGLRPTGRRDSASL